ncbi:MAG: hypothetical protein EXX96DRAFT_545979 [Benjaminiella poitrasii]|nr:MAG: hypothetical protein EXX96DRAFT_545979 [Benjaminiella poitrasii]
MPLSYSKLFPFFLLLYLYLLFLYTRIIMAFIHLNSTEKAIFIILSSLLCVVLLLVLLVVFKKRHMFLVQRDSQLWNFIMIDSPEHMSRLKKKTESFLSFNSNRRSHRHYQLQYSFTHSLLQQDKVIEKQEEEEEEKYYSVNSSPSSSVIFLPQSPPPVYKYYSANDMNYSFSSLSSLNSL